MNISKQNVLFGTHHTIRQFQDRHTGDLVLKNRKCVREREREIKMKQAEKRIQTIRRHLTSSGTS